MGALRRGYCGYRCSCGVLGIRCWGIVGVRNGPLAIWCISTTTAGAVGVSSGVGAVFVAAHFGTMSFSLFRQMACQEGWIRMG